MKKQVKMSPITNKIIVILLLLSGQYNNCLTETKSCSQTSTTQHSVHHQNSPSISTCCNDKSSQSICPPLRGSNIKHLMDEIGLTKSRQTPVIGIVTAVFRDYKKFFDKKLTHMAASYVKWIESAGAQVMPIFLNQDDDYYKKVFNMTNGLVFPGGDNLLDPKKRTPLMEAAKKLYKMAVEANDRGDYYPIWGTCLGLELLSVVTSGRNVLSNCSATDVNLAMEFTSDRGKLFGERKFPGLPNGFDYSKAMMNLMEEKNLTYNYHHFCLTDQDLIRGNLTGFYKPLAYSYDINNIKFISAFEAIDYPFYGVQFHPEKSAFEFIVRKGQKNVPHEPEAISVARYLADFFISQAELNKHQTTDLKTLQELRKMLIYSSDPSYLSLVGDIYEQRYVFPYTEVDGISDEEFVDHVLQDDEEVPEKVTN